MNRIQNNFEFLRISAALLVLVSHHYPLSNLGEPGLPGVISLGGVAVMVFFSISGFLVTQSWLSDPNAFRFAWRRILRIWPALITVVLLSTLILGPIVTNLTVFDYFAHRATWDYLRTLIMEIHFPLPGVFTNNPGGSSVNGSLWTIPFEVRCYLFMAIIGITGLLKNKKWIIAWCIIFFAWYINKGIPDIVGKYIPGREFSAYFIMGVILQCTQKILDPLYQELYIHILFNRNHPLHKWLPLPCFTDQRTCTHYWPRKGINTCFE